MSESSTFCRIHQTSILLRRHSPKSSIGFVDTRIITKLPREPPSSMTCGKFSTSSLQQMQLVIFSMPATFSFFLMRWTCLYICATAVLQWIDVIIQYDVMKLSKKWLCYMKVSSMEWLKTWVMECDNHKTEQTHSSSNRPRFNSILQSGNLPQQKLHLLQLHNLNKV